MSKVDLEGLMNASAQAAAKWEAQGDRSWAARNYVSATLAALRVAVKEPGEAGGVVYLETHDAPHLLERAVVHTEGVSQDIDLGKLAPSVAGGMYQLCALTHLAWLMSASGLANRLLLIAGRPHCRGKATPFWNEYAVALESLAKRVPYSPPVHQGKGERLWVAYLELIADLTNGRSVEESSAKVASGFGRRNKDKRVADDTYGIDGSASEPAHWDFRMASILRAFAGEPTSPKQVPRP